MIPGRKIGRQHTPLTTRSGTVEDGIQDFTDIDKYGKIAYWLRLRDNHSSAARFTCSLTLSSSYLALYNMITYTLTVRETH